MFDDIIYIVLISFTLCSIIICAMITDNVPNIKEIEAQIKAQRLQLQHNEEEVQKNVKQCVLDMNYREDCKYIIYEDFKQSKIHDPNITPAVIIPLLLH